MMFESNNNESWSDFNSKFGREGSKTKLLSSMGLARTDSARKLPERSSSMPKRGAGLVRAASATGAGLVRAASGDGLLAMASAVNRSGSRKCLLSKTKSHTNVMTGSELRAMSRKQRNAVMSKAA